MIKKITDGPCMTNCYIVKSEISNNAIIIDPAYNPTAILNECAGCIVEYIIITHSHIDHIMALDEIKKRTGAQVVISKADSFSLNNKSTNLADTFNVPSPTTQADIKVDDGDTLWFDGKDIKFILTPGHTTGSMTIDIKGVLFTGDTLFLESVGRCDFPGGSQNAIVASIKQKLFTYPDNTVVYPGHGESTTIKHEKENNFFVI